MPGDATWWSVGVVVGVGGRLARQVGRLLEHLHGRIDLGQEIVDLGGQIDIGNLGDLRRFDGGLEQRLCLDEPAAAALRACCSGSWVCTSVQNFACLCSFSPASLRRQRKS